MVQNIFFKWVKFASVAKELLFIENSKFCFKKKKKIAHLIANFLNLKKNQKIAQHLAFLTKVSETNLFFMAYNIMNINMINIPLGNRVNVSRHHSLVDR